MPHTTSSITSRLTAIFILLLLRFFFPCAGLCQQFHPVHGTVVVQPPYGLYLSDYYTGSRDRLIITLLNRDLERQQLQVRLRIKISNGMGFTLQSREEVPYPMLTLDPGVPLRLTAQDITPYLLPENISLNGRLDNGRLPTGMTEFSVQVVEYQTRKVLSQWAVGRAWIDIKKPPVLNLPTKNEEIFFREPTSIRFQWMPQHQGLANTEYEFVLKELPDNGIAPQGAFAYGMEIFRTSTRFTNLTYTHLDPQLLPDRRYGWQVRAIARDGIDEIGMFENNGFSEVDWFRLNEQCTPPIQVKGSAGFRKLDIEWTSSPQQQAYIVAHRPKSEHNLYQWIEERVFGTKTTIYKLKPGCTYEYRVGALCSSDKPVYSPTEEVVMPMENTQRIANCGNLPTLAPLSREPNRDIIVGDTVIIGGDYPMTVLQIQHLGDGWYSGKGKTMFTWIFETTLAVQFDRLRINIDKQQIDGKVHAVYDDKKSQIANLDEIDDGGRTIQTAGGITYKEVKVDFSIPEIPEAQYNHETGEVIITDSNGTPQTINVPKNEEGKPVFPFVLTDKNGDQYKIDKDEQTEESETEENSAIKVEKVEKLPTFDPSKLDETTNIRIIFARGKGKYAFDDIGESWYKRAVKLSDYTREFGKGYIAPWKLVPSGEKDVVEARLISDKEVDTSKIKFASEDGTVLTSQYKTDAQCWEINLTGVNKNEQYNVFALYDEKPVGKLCVVSYPTQKQTLTLVPVNVDNIDRNAIERELNAIYNPVGVSFTVHLDENETLRNNRSWDLDGDGKLNLKGGRLMDKDVKLSPEMEALQNMYKTTPAYQPDGVYIFLVKNAISAENEMHPDGEMPRGKRFGYVFGNNPTPVRTIAHELGHGIFTLKHTFDNEYGSKKSSGKTTNLMDYANGTNLAAFQWNIIANQALITIFDKAEEGKNVEAVDSAKEKLLRELVIRGEDHCIFVVQCDKNSQAGNDIILNHKFKAYLLQLNTNQQGEINPRIVAENNEETDYIKLSPYQENQIKLFSGIESIESVSIIKLVNGSIVQCPAGSINYPNVCSVASPLDISNFKQQLKSDLARCGDGGSSKPAVQEQIDKILLTNLQAIAKSSRSNQNSELEYWDETQKKSRYFTLKNDALAEVQNPLTDKQINNGEWTDATAETKTRYTVNLDGIIQIRAFGIKKDLKLANGKTANLPELANHIKEQTNKFLLENRVTKFYQEAPVFKDDGEVFADGKQIVIGGHQSTFFKIVSEGIGLTTTLLKTGEVEEKTYLDNRKDEVVITAPGMLTGSFEVIAQKVTDITSLGSLVYDLTVDEQVKTETYKQLKGIKDEIANDPGTFLPIFGEILLTVTTGNTSAEMQAIFDENADSGKRSHLATRGTGNAIITAMSGAALVKNLPEIGDKLTDWVKKVSKSRSQIRKMLTTDAGKDYLQKYFDKFVSGETFHEWFEKAKNFKLGKDLNFEVHHVIPLNILEKNKELQRILAKFDFDFNGVDNAIPLQKKSLKKSQAGHANHPDYDRFMRKEIEGILGDSRISDVEKFKEIKKLVNKAKNKLETDVLLGNKDVNQIIKL